MKVRNIKTQALGYSSEFNIHSLDEIIVYFEDGDCSSEFISDYEAYLSLTSGWVNMNEAFESQYIIINNENTNFREPYNDHERERGWYY